MNYYLPEIKKTEIQKLFDYAKMFCAPQVYLADRNTENTQLQIYNSQFLQNNSQQFSLELETRKEEFILEKTKLDYLLQLGRDQISQDFSEKQADLSFQRQIQITNLSADRQKNLEQYRQQCENIRQHGRQEWEAFILAERHRLELETQKYSQSFAVLQMYLQNQISHDTEQFRRILDSHPWRLQPTTILKQYEIYRQGNRPIPPLIVISPPDVNFDRYGSQSNQLVGNMAKSLEEEMRVFFDKYNNSEQLVNFKAGIWDTKRMASDTAATHLHDLFGTIPTIILESEVEGDLLNFRVFWWEMGAEVYQSKTILSQFSLTDLLFEIQRDHAQKWEKEKSLLESADIDLESILIEGSDEAINDFNLGQLKTEQKLREIGSTIKVSYHVHHSGVLELKKYLRVLHCLVGGLAVDDYHLIHYGIFPTLPKIIGNLLADVSEQEALSLLDVLVSHYHYFAEVMTNMDSVRAPEVMLSISQELSKQTVAHSHALKLIKIAVSSWLEIRQIDIGEDVFETLDYHLTITDLEFVANLNQCLKNLGDSRYFNIAKSYYKRGLYLNQEQEYDSAEIQLDQAIAWEPHAEAYFQRGIARLNLKKYVNAIQDFDQAIVDQTIKINSSQYSKPDIHEYYGDAYMGIKDFTNAIIHYNKAVEQGSIHVVEKQEQAIKKESCKPLLIELPNNGGKLELIWIPPGKLTMENGHIVILPEFRMSKYPITQRQYQAIIGSNPSYFQGDLEVSEIEQIHKLEVVRVVNPVSNTKKTCLGYTQAMNYYLGKSLTELHRIAHSHNIPIENNKVAMCRALSKLAPFLTDEVTSEIDQLHQQDRPVDQVSWNDAIKFCEKLTAKLKMNGQVVTLPSEAQWEYAAQGVSNSKNLYHYYSGSDNLNKVGWYKANSGGKTHPVGQLEPNELGLCDMSGNVWEWCQDNWGNLSLLPADGTPLRNRGNPSWHPLRGGAWNSGNALCSITARNQHNASISSYNVGFRVVLSAV